MLSSKDLLKKYYRPTLSSSHFEAVKDASIEVPFGKITEITGRSGSGKSTLLYMLAGLLTPSKGNVFYGDKDLYSMSDKELSNLRNREFGIIPQGQSGVYSMNVLDNVKLPAVILNGSSDGVDEYANKLLERVGIIKLKSSMLNELSGGEMRRLAIARALILKPKVLFADEPTDDLDEENTKLVLELLRQVADDGCAVLLVTHEKEASSYADIIYKMEKGSLLPL